MSFNTGDRIRLRDDARYRDCMNDPKWGGKYGNVAGTIKHVSNGNSYPISVIWDNGKSISYNEKDLQLVEIELQFKIVKK